MTTLQLAALVNFTGTFVAWLIAATFVRNIPRLFFRTWTAAYNCGLLVAAIEGLAVFWPRPAWLMVIEAGLTVASASLFLKTSAQIEERPFPRHLTPAVGLAAMLYTAALLSQGISFETAFALPVLFLAITFFRLGFALCRLGTRTGTRCATWPALPLILHGAMIFCVPLLRHLDAVWVGYCLIGLIDALVGVGMVVFMLEHTAWQLRAQNRDLMDAKAHLNRYRLLAERARDIILILSPKGQVIEANQAAVTAYGYPYEELLSKSLRDLRAPETLAQLDADLSQADAQGLLLETLHIDKLGTRFPVEVSAQGMDLEGQRVLVSIIRDISERQRLEEALRAQNQRLLELDRLKGDFINSASHELRTPLTSIKGYAEFLEDEVGGPMSAEQHAFVRQIQEGATRLQRIIDDMLDFARMEAGTFTLVWEDAELGALARQEVSSMVPQAQEARLSLEVELPEEPIRVRMDPRRIGQVILNLLSNAIKFTPAGGRIVVRVLPGDERVRVEVADTGIGIAADHMPLLFEKFFQVDPSSTRLHGGAGLGLAISKALVEAHGGLFGLDSELGRGSTFWLELTPAGAATAVPERRRFTRQAD